MALHATAFDRTVKQSSRMSMLLSSIRALLAASPLTPALTVEGPVKAGGVQNSAGVGAMLFLPPGRTKA